MDAFWSVLDGCFRRLDPPERADGAPRRRAEAAFGPRAAEGPAAAERECALQRFVVGRLRVALARVFEDRGSRTFAALDRFLTAPSLDDFVLLYKRAMHLLLRYRLRLPLAQTEPLARQACAVAAFLFRRDPRLAHDLRLERARALLALRGPDEARLRAVADGGWLDRGASALGFDE